MLIMYLGTSPILALKSHILSEVHFIGKTGGAEIATCPCAHSWCAVELAFTPLWVQPQGLHTWLLALLPRPPSAGSQGLCVGTRVRWGSDWPLSHPGPRPSQLPAGWIAPCPNPMVSSAVGPNRTLAQLPPSPSHIFDVTGPSHHHLENSWTYPHHLPCNLRKTHTPTNPSKGLCHLRARSCLSSNVLCNSERGSQRLLLTFPPSLVASNLIDSSY